MSANSYKSAAPPHSSLKRNAWPDFTRSRPGHSGFDVSRITKKSLLCDVFYSLGKADDMPRIRFLALEEGGYVSKIVGISLGMLLVFQ